MFSKATERQLEVLQLLSRRLALKSIAHEMGISESRVNQHVRNLKQIANVNDIAELVAAFQSYTALQATADMQAAYRIPAATITANTHRIAEIQRFSPPQAAVQETCQISTSIRSEVPPITTNGQSGFRDDSGVLQFSDNCSSPQEVAWPILQAPKFVSGTLNERDPVASRLITIMLISFCTLAILALTVSVANGLGLVFGSYTVVPEEKASTSD